MSIYYISINNINIRPPTALHTAQHFESRLKLYHLDCRPYLPLAQCGLKTDLDPRQN